MNTIDMYCCDCRTLVCTVECDDPAALTAEQINAATAAGRAHCEVCAVRGHWLALSQLFDVTFEAFMPVSPADLIFN